MSTSNPTTPPLDSLSIVERCCSVLSLLGCIFIISTFCLDKAFRKPINRLVFYASFGNLMTNVATLIARSFIDRPESAGCQFQAFMIQMFMPADALWTMAMALNVYLTFYHKFDARRLRKMDTAYLVFCYGVPFVLALTLIFISTPERGRLYGNATLWCWVSPTWDIMRIATFYGPVWIVTLVTFFIYLRAGKDIYKRHKQLREFSSTTHRDAETTVIRSSVVVADSFTSTRTTEVSVTTEVLDTNTLNGLGGPSAGLRRGSHSSSSGAGSGSPNSRQPPAAYSVTISSSNRRPTLASAAAAAAAITAPDRRSISYSPPSGEVNLPIQGNTTTTTTPAERPQTASRSNNNNPTSSNPRRRAAYEANSAILSYTKCALLFFTAMLVTWIPSSANRVYSVVHGGQTSMALEFMSAAVLPLQGFWNAIIYAVTSWKAVKMLFNGQSLDGSSRILRSLSRSSSRGGRERRSGSGRNGGLGTMRRGGTGPKIQELVGVRTFQGVNGGGVGLGGVKISGNEKIYGSGGGSYNYSYESSNGSQSESMTELAKSNTVTSTSNNSTRPSSNDRDGDSPREENYPVIRF